jgi:hypothetical protein
MPSPKFKALAMPGLLRFYWSLSASTMSAARLPNDRAGLDAAYKFERREYTAAKKKSARFTTLLCGAALFDQPDLADGWGGFPFQSTIKSALPVTLTLSAMSSNPMLTPP